MGGANRLSGWGASLLPPREIVLCADEPERGSGWGAQVTAGRGFTEPGGYASSTARTSFSLMPSTRATWPRRISSERSSVAPSRRDGQTQVENQHSRCATGEPRVRQDAGRPIPHLPCRTRLASCPALTACRLRFAILAPLAAKPGDEARAAPRGEIVRSEAAHSLTATR